MHGRDETDQHLCDVCYWRVRYNRLAQPLERLETELAEALASKGRISKRAEAIRRELVEVTKERDELKRQIIRNAELVCGNDAVIEQRCSQLERDLRAALAQVAQMREALEHVSQAIQTRIQGKLPHAYVEQQFPATYGHTPLNEYWKTLGSELVNIAAALSSPPPPVVPMADVRPTIQAFQAWFSTPNNAPPHEWVRKERDAGKALHNFLTKYPQTNP